MIVRKFISLLAQKIYKQHYDLLKGRLLSSYSGYNFQDSCQRNIYLERLLISAEDHRFRYHIGFDIIAIIRAFRNRVLYSKIEGASTIEQQLVRVLIKRFERNPRRKIREIFLATTLAYLIPRNQIPILYLYNAYYGTNMNGLQQILKKFQIDYVNSVTLESAAEIVARLKYPEPEKHNEKRSLQIQYRKNHILNLYSRHSSRRLFKVY